MLRPFLQNTFAALALSAGVLGAIDFNYVSTISEPEKVIMHIQQAYWLDDQGAKYPLLPTTIDLDVTLGCSVDITRAVHWAQEKGVTPTSLIIEASRHFEVQASAFIETTKATAHTQEGQKELEVEGIKHIAIAAIGEGEAGLQTCWIPESKEVNFMLEMLGFQVLENGTVAYQVSAENITSSTTAAKVEFSPAFIEFATTQPDLPVFIIPHLPAVSIVVQE